MKPKVKLIKNRVFNIIGLMGMEWCSINELKQIFKQGKIMRDNNCKANHDSGLQERIDNYNTMETVRHMKSNPVNVNARIKHKFYGNVLKILKLA